MDLLAVLESGATMITATSRLARDLRGRYNAWQRDRGRQSWPTPDVVPFDAFLSRTFESWVYSPHGGAAPVLLKATQECAAWEAIIGAREDYPLLDSGGTARRASEAWKIAHDYRLPIRFGSFRASEDCEAFLGWAREYDQHCRDHRWLDRATLPEFLLNRVASDELHLPTRTLYAGFDALAPRELEWFQVLRAEPVLAPRHEPRIRKIALPDAAHEIEAAAAWARVTLEKRSAGKIGVIVPDLSAQRKTVERVFRQTLVDPAAFHISLGRPLADYPVIYAALLILEACSGPLPLSRAGVLLRSPFLAGAATEASARAALDAQLRRRGLLEVSLSDTAGMGALASESKQLPEKQRASAWSAAFARLLKSSGWPGDGKLDSVMHQAAQAWRELLSEFACLDVTLGALTYTHALERLRRLANEITFQPEDLGPPVQMMGTLEAAGLTFDALWIMGLHDGEFPPPHRPNSFLPLDLQRDHRVPHSTAALELERSRRLLEHLTHCASNITLSCPLHDGEQELRRTPLIDGDWEVLSPEARPVRFVVPQRVQDDKASPLPLNSESLGGASLLKEMAACSFRAFARYRLRARPLEDAGFGLSAADQGSALHYALELFWQETQSHSALLGMAQQELCERIERCVEKALEGQSGKIAHGLEMIRLRRLLFEWMQLEKNRGSYTVLAREERIDVALGGLRLKIRPDRMDELPDRRLVILDYKTGEVTKNGWSGDRPAEPQLPLYAVAYNRSVAAMALARVRTGEMGFTGVDEAATLGQVKGIELDESNLSAQIPRWKKILENLATRFRAGDAFVDPQPGACEFCGLQAFCRIQEGAHDDRDA